MSMPVLEAGLPGGQEILFLHASPLAGRMWLPQLERLTEFHCLAPDLPGHGRSASIPIDMHQIVSELVSLIRETSPSQKAHIVGLSFGGVVAQALMVDAPDAIDHVVLSGTATRMSRALVWIAMLNEPVLRLLSPDQLAGLLCLQFGIPAKHRAALRDDFQSFSPRTLAQVMAAYRDIETPAHTKSPTLVAVGQKETLYARRAARNLCRTIPGAKGFVVPRCGHVWNLEAPDLFSETVRSWILDRPLPQGLEPFRAA